MSVWDHVFIIRFPDRETGLETSSQKYIRSYKLWIVYSNWITCWRWIRSSQMIYSLLLLRKKKEKTKQRHQNDGRDVNIFPTNTDHCCFITECLQFLSLLISKFSREIKFCSFNFFTSPVPHNESLGSISWAGTSKS